MAAKGGAVITGEKPIDNICCKASDFDEYAKSTFANGAEPKRQKGHDPSSSEVLEITMTTEAFHRRSNLPLQLSIVGFYPLL